ncbi:SLBB domain-containing protein [Pelagicoccus sp. SDUM812005]|uniref:SLBB domain-containing protein n=1 Tax=Pelagicoccus sp. SDUM812005 TaxID=3041257 RepID=UPI0028102309|nr:SLBB domain-containing protein [Pelagicoccus sp. SDUM812005]MDQ8180795.1 SLBB domain-containing protein [Pelagicoccus sp. SDUM812005]
MKLLNPLLLLALAFSAATASQAQTLSAEQQAKLNSLPAPLRAQAMDELRKYQSQQSSNSANQALETPEVVKKGTPKAKEGNEQVEEEFDTAGKLADEEEKSEAKVVKDELKQFGYDLFEGSPTTFAPVTEIPVPVDYVIGPGDQVRIQFFGKQAASYDLYVSRDGVLQIPDLGPMPVAGQSFNELKTTIVERVKEQMIGVDAFVSLGELRSMRIFMLGDVNRPGAYTVSSLSTLTNALFVSGGIRPIGSLRNIQLKRNGEVVATLDLYELLLNGDTSSDARLQPGDVIFVPPVGTLVGIAGEVRRPAIYEIKEDTSIQTLFEMAGGLTPKAYPSISQIERISSSGLKELIDVDLSASDKRSDFVQNGDIIRIFSALDRVENFVRLQGAVERPGDYAWKEGQRISNIIPHVEQLLPTADLDYALVVSRNPITGVTTTRSFSLEQLFLHKDSKHDLLLEPKDRIMVFDATPVDREAINEKGEKLKPHALTEAREGLGEIVARLKAQSTSEEPQKVVTITGRVRHPGEYPLDRSMNVSDLVRAAGGFTEDAYTLQAELVRYQDNNKTNRDSLLIPVSLAGSLSDSAGQQDIALQEFDQLNIKRVPEWTEQETITIKGEVKFPGTYVVERGERLSQVIERAGGITDLAHPESAVFLRESLRLSEAANLKKLRERLSSDIAAASIQSDAISLDGVETAQSLLDQLENTEAVGRLVINLPDILDGLEDITVIDGDELIIKQRPQAVTIIGSVNYPTSHLYQSGLSHIDYINLSGGLTKKADKKQIYIVRANGQVVTEQRSRFFPKGGTIIEAGDTVVVPIDVDRVAPLKLWTTTSQIFYQIALGAAAINSF